MISRATQRTLSSLENLKPKEQDSKTKTDKQESTSKLFNYSSGVTGHKNFLGKLFYNIKSIFCSDSDQKKQLNSAIKINNELIKPLDEFVNNQSDNTKKTLTIDKYNFEKTHDSVIIKDNKENKEIKTIPLSEFKQEFTAFAKNEAASLIQEMKNKYNPDKAHHPQNKNNQTSLKSKETSQLSGSKIKDEYTKFLRDSDDTRLNNIKKCNEFKQDMLSPEVAKNLNTSDKATYKDVLSQIKEKATSLLETTQSGNYLIKKYHNGDKYVSQMQDLLDSVNSQINAITLNTSLNISNS